MMTFLTTYWYIPVAVAALVVFLVVKNKAKTASTAPQATPVPATAAKPVVAPVVTSVASAILASNFPSAAALKAAIVSEKINYMVILDNVVINSGFGPAQAFFTQADGSVSTTAPVVAKPAAPVVQAPVAPSVTTIAPVQEHLGTDFKDQYPAVNVNLQDALFLAHQGMEFRVTVSSKVDNVELHFAILSGTRQQVVTAMNQAYIDNASKIAKFNVDTYSGPLKSRYAELLAGIAAGTVHAVTLPG